MVRVTPLALANTFIERHGATSGIDHMKLQKLCYYAHGWWLAYNPEPFLTERPEVWKYGPVFRRLYAVMADFGSRPITQPQKPLPFNPPPLIEDRALIDLSDWIWTKYGCFTAFTLSDMTHAPGTPWRNVAEQYDYKVPSGLELPDDDVAAFFKREAAELEAA